MVSCPEYYSNSAWKRLQMPENEALRGQDCLPELFHPIMESSVPQGLIPTPGATNYKPQRVSGKDSQAQTPLQGRQRGKGENYVRGW